MYTANQNHHWDCFLFDQSHLLVEVLDIFFHKQQIFFERRAEKDYYTTTPKASMFTKGSPDHNRAAAVFLCPLLINQGHGKIISYFKKKEKKKTG